MPSFKFPHYFIDGVPHLLKLHKILDKFNYLMKKLIINTNFNSTSCTL
jgi:hypothetical protein